MPKGAHLYRHGASGSKTYMVWGAMVQRCNNPSSQYYKNYGGRGISLCERWHSFTNFLSDMGEKPDGSMLDRIENDGNYCPENCRWATRITQMNNKRSNKIIRWNSQSKTVADWARQFHIPYSTFRMRLKNGWPMEKALGVDK